MSRAPPRPSILLASVLAVALVSCAPAAAPRPAAPAPAPPAPAPAPRRAPPAVDLPAWPPRPDGAPSGSAFARSLEAADERGREEAIERELCRGNVPDYVRRLARVDARGETRSGRAVTLTLWVTPDYLAVGHDADSVRVPMAAVTAQLVADRLGFVLPTAKIVDLVYRAAAAKLTPRTFPPSAAMVRVEAFVRHDELVDAQLGSGPPVGLVAGHKKDVVVSNRLQGRPHRLALYGWHRADGQPIQPLSTAHGDWYADYSHGVRLVAPTVLVDGDPVPTADVLRDPELSPLLTDEGPLVSVRYRTEGGTGRASWRPSPAERGAPPRAARRAHETP